MGDTFRGSELLLNDLSCSFNSVLGRRLLCLLNWLDLLHLLRSRLRHRLSLHLLLWLRNGLGDRLSRHLLLWLRNGLHDRLSRHLLLWLRNGLRDRLSRHLLHLLLR